MKRFAARQLNEDTREMGALLFAARERRQLPATERTDGNLVHGRLDKRMRGGDSHVARPHADDLLDREWKRDVDVLRQRRAMGCQL